MNKEIKEKLNTLRQFRARVAESMKPVNALEKELKKAQADFKKEKTALAALREKAGPESPEYSVKSTEVKALRPAIERKRMFLQRAVAEIPQLSEFESQQSIISALSHFFQMFKDKVVEHFAPYYPNAADALHNSGKVDCVQRFQWNIRQTNIRFDQPAEELAEIRSRLRLIDEVLSPKPDFVKYFKIKAPFTV